MNTNLKSHKRVYVSKQGHRIKCIHEDGSFRHIGKLLEDYNPQLVLEFGFSWGGMTKLFEDYTDAEIHAWNIRCKRRPDPKNFGDRVKFHYKDILTNPLPEITKLLEDERKKFLYCDNGNKVRETLMYVPYLNKGDLFGVHDWPREIYTRWISKVKKRNTKEEIEQFANLLKDFEPVKHDFFEEKDFSSRFWVRVRK